MTLPRSRFLAGAALALASLAWPQGAARAAGEVNLYTTREPKLIQPLLELFTARTGIKVNTAFMNAGLAERVAAEGARSPADVLMTVDVGSLVDLDSKGLTQPTGSARISAALASARYSWRSLLVIGLCQPSRK